MTNPDNVGWLPLLQFAVFDEFGKGADDRVWDYGRRCFEAGKLCRAAPAGGDDGAAEKWCICRSCMVIVRLPADTPLPGRCQCSPSSWSLTRLRIPKGYELRREASADVERCDSCDGTGLLHRADGMYVGECHCVHSAPAGGDDQKEYEMDKTIYELAIQCGAYVDGGDIPDHSTGFPGSEPTFEFTERQLEAFVAKLREQRVGDTRPLTASDLRDM